MNKPYLYKSEFSIPPDDHPVSREHDEVPAYRIPDIPAPPEEFAEPAPEFLPPGTFVSEQRDVPSRARKLKKLLLALTSAAAVFLFLRPIGLLSSPVSASPQGTAAEGSAVSTQSDLSLDIFYALLDGNTVRYSYAPALGRQESDPDSLLWKYPVSVAAEVSDEQGGTAVPAHDPDVWDRPRDSAEYEIDASGLSGDMVLTLTAACDTDGDVRTLEKKLRVIPMPPEPEITTELSAAAAGEDAPYTIEYSARFTPDPSDTNSYDLTVTSFGINWYDEAGEYRGGRLGTGGAEEEFSLSDTYRDGDSWVFTYSGPADLPDSDGITQFSVVLKLQDQKTRIPFTIETELTPIPGLAGRESVLPVAEIVAFSFYSEMYGGISFSDMEDATSVILEIVDPNLETVEQRLDITEEALNDLYYSIGSFTTDLLYENHEDYYSQDDVPFPMSVEFRVVIEYGDGQTTSYSAMTREELNMFEASYIPENDRWAGEEAGSIYFTTLPSVEYPDTEIVFGQPEKVTGPGIISISAEFDGVPVDPSLITVNSSERHAIFYGGVDDGKEADVVYREVVIRKPSEIPDNDGRTAVLYITHYLASYDMVTTSEFRFELRGYE